MTLWFLVGVCLGVGGGVGQGKTNAESLLESEERMAPKRFFFNCLLYSKCIFSVKWRPQTHARSARLRSLTEVNVPRSV